MTEKSLREFLNYRSKSDMISQCKVWVLMYSIFVILFIDVHFCLNLDTLKDNKIWILINVMLTGLILPFTIICNKKTMDVAQIFLFESMIVFGISIEFFYLFLFKCVMGVYNLSTAYFVIIFVMISLIVLALLYRRKKLTKKIIKNKSPILFVSVSSLGICFASLLRFAFKNSEIKDEILGCGLCILGFVFLMIACFDVQNFIICKQHKFKG